MTTFSLCMIVKNEEKVLARCLDSLADIMDEIIIVDTGSTDNTKEIASRYTDKIYDFKWTGSFADARNFASAKAKMDYIYTADADEYLEEEDRKHLINLKKVLMPEIEIVQMLYCTPAELSTVYNFEEEYRPKLYKRRRTFTLCGISIFVKESLFQITGNIRKQVCLLQTRGLIPSNWSYQKIYTCLMTHLVGASFSLMKQTSKTIIFVFMLI